MAGSVSVSGRWGRWATGRAAGVARFQARDLAPVALQRGEYVLGLPRLLWVGLGSPCLFAGQHVAVEHVHLGDQAEQFVLQDRERGGAASAPVQAMICSASARSASGIRAAIVLDAGAGVGDVGLGKVAQAVQVLQAGEHLVTMEASGPGPWFLFWHGSEYRPGCGSCWAVVSQSTARISSRCRRTRRAPRFRASRSRNPATALAAAAGASAPGCWRPGCGRNVPGGGPGQGVALAASGVSLPEFTVSAAGHLLCAGPPSSRGRYTGADHDLGSSDSEFCTFGAPSWRRGGTGVPTSRSRPR